MSDENSFKNKQSSKDDEDELESLFYLNAIGFFSGVLCVFWLDINFGWIGIIGGVIGFFFLGVSFYLDWIRRKHPDP